MQTQIAEGVEQGLSDPHMIKGTFTQAHQHVFTQKKAAGTRKDGGGAQIRKNTRSQSALHRLYGLNASMCLMKSKAKGLMSWGSSCVRVGFGTRFSFSQLDFR